jgi:hypothetical protein
MLTVSISACGFSSLFPVAGALIVLSTPAKDSDRPQSVARSSVPVFLAGWGLLGGGGMLFGMSLIGSIFGEWKHADGGGYSLHGPSWLTPGALCVDALLVLLAILMLFYRRRMGNRHVSGVADRPI